MTVLTNKTMVQKRSIFTSVTIVFIIKRTRVKELVTILKYEFGHPWKFNFDYNKMFIVCGGQDIHIKRFIQNLQKPILSFVFDALKHLLQN